MYLKWSLLVKVYKLSSIVVVFQQFEVVLVDPYLTINMQNIRNLY